MAQRRRQTLGDLKAGGKVPPAIARALAEGSQVKRKPPPRKRPAAGVVRPDVVVGYAKPKSRSSARETALLRRQVARERAKLKAGKGPKVDTGDVLASQRRTTVDTGNILEGRRVPPPRRKKPSFGEALLQEVSGEGAVAKALAKVLVPSSKPVTFTVKGKKHTFRPGEERVAGIPGAPKLSNLDKALLSDAVRLPKDAVQGLYEVGAAAKEAAGGDTKRAKRLIGGLDDGVLGHLVHGDLKGALKAFEEHPLYGGLEFTGSGQVLGRGGGAVARRGVVGKRAKRAAGTKRAPLRVEGTNQKLERRYSPNVIVKGLQVAVEKDQRKRGLDPDVARGRKRSRLLNAEVDEFAAQAEGTRRRGREEAARVGARIAPVRRGDVAGGRRARAEAAVDRARSTSAEASALPGVRGRAERHVVLAAVEGRLRGPKTFREDLLRERSRLQDVYVAERTQMSASARRANRAQVRALDRTLNDPKAMGNAAEVFRAADDYNSVAGPVERALIEKGALDPEQADAARLRTYGVSVMGLRPSQKARAPEHLEERHAAARDAEAAARERLQRARAAEAKAKARVDRVSGSNRATRAADAAKGSGRPPALVRVGEKKYEGKLPARDAFIAERPKADRRDEPTVEKLTENLKPGGPGTAIEPEFVRTRDRVTGESVGWGRELPGSKVVVRRDEGGRVIGAMQMMLDADGKPTLLSIAVDPKHRGKGIGSGLVKAAVDAGYDVRAAVDAYTEAGAALKHKLLSEEGASPLVAGLYEVRRSKGKDARQRAYYVGDERFTDRAAADRRARATGRKVRPVARPVARTVREADRTGRATQVARQHEKAKAGRRNAAMALRQATAARAASKPTRRVSGLEDADGKPVSTQAIREHIAATGNREPGFVGQRRADRGAASFFVNWYGGRKTVDSKRRTGEAARTGAYDASFGALEEHLVRGRGVVDAIGTFDDFVGRMGSRRRDGTPYTYDEAVRAADELSDGTGMQWLPVRAVPARYDKATQEAILDAQGTAAIPQHLESLTLGRLDDSLKPPTGQKERQARNVVLVPAQQVQRFAAHQTSGSSTGAKLGQSLTRAFRNTVLPFSTKWLTGNVAEAVLRSAAAGITPADVVRGGRVMRSLRGLDEQAWKAADTRIRGGLLYGSADRLNVRRRPEDFEGTRLEGPAQAAAFVARLPVVRQTIGGLGVFTRSVFALNRGLERAFQTGVIGKQARIEAQELTGSWVKALRMQEDVAREVAQGLLGTSKQIQFARMADEVLGQYGRFSPGTRRVIQSYAPFLPWFLNAARFVWWTLPARHPAKTALLANVEMTLQDDLDAFRKTVPPGDLESAIRRKDGGLVNLARYTPFGVVTKGAEGIADPLLPQIDSAVAALKGQSFTGRPLQTQDGKDPSDGKKLWLALYTLAEGAMPGVQIARRVREKGATPFDDSNVLYPKTKPGTARSGAADRILNPVRPTYLSATSSGGAPATAEQKTEAKQLQKQAVQEKAALEREARAILREAEQLAREQRP